MPKNDFFTSVLRLGVMAVVWVATLSVHAQPAVTAQPSSGAKSSIQTVDELLRQENAALLEKSRPVAPPGPSTTRVVHAKPSPPTVVVDSIYGAAASLKTDLVVNGSPHEGLRPGANIGGCVISEIANSCVVLVPSTPKTRADMCPKSCWTGERPVVALGNGGVSGGLDTRAGQPMPMPAPLPMSSQMARQPAPAASIPR